MSKPLLELIDVYKSYGSVEVLRGLSLSVEPGEVFGFLGKNGAGKSTAIRAIMGIIRPDAGDIRLFGEPLRHDVVALRQRVGYVAQEQHFYQWMTPLQLGKFVAGFYPNWDRGRYKELLASFALPLRRKLGTFSGGMKARLALAVALSSAPRLLILDEPTAGMDPIARREFSQLVREQAAHTEASVFFSTHLVDEIEAVASRVGIVECGRALYAGDLASLRQQIASYCIDEGNPDAAIPHALLAPMATRCLSDVSVQNKRTLVLQFPPHIAPSIAQDSQWREAPMTLEDTFVALVAASTIETAS